MLIVPQHSRKTFEVFSEIKIVRKIEHSTFSFFAQYDELLKDNRWQ